MKETRTLIFTIYLKGFTGYKQCETNMDDNSISHCYSFENPISISYPYFEIWLIEYNLF